MEPTLYVETNFLIGMAMGRDTLAADLLARPDVAFRVVVPDVCFMEAFSVLEREKAAQHQFVEGYVRRYENEAGRNLASAYAKDLKALLGEARIKISELLNETEERLRQIVVWICGHAEIIPADSESVRQALAERYLKEPTDNLIFHLVVRHARSRGPGPKAFLSGNSKDFGSPDVRESLEAAGLKYFKLSGAAIGWLESHRPS